LSLERVFGDLGRNEAWVAELAAALQDLDARGARSVLLDL
jgi:hypothetical protein